MSRASGQKQNQEEIGLLDLVSFLLRAAPVMLLFVATTGAFTYWRYSSAPMFTADGTLQVESSKSNPMQAVTEKIAGMTGGADDTDRLIDKYFLLFLSREFNVAVAQRIQRNGRFERIANHLRGRNGPPITTVEEMANKILELVQANKTTSETFRLGISLSTPKAAIETVNEMMDSFSAALIERESRDLSEAKHFIESQLAEVEVRTTVLDEDIARRSKLIRSPAGAIGAPGAPRATNEDHLEQATFMLSEQLAEIQALITEAQAQSAREAPEENGSPTDKYGSQAGLESLRRKQQLIKLRYDATKKLLDEVRSAPNSTARVEREIQDLYRRKELEYTLFADLKKQIMNIDVQKISIRNKIKVLDRPTAETVRTGETLKPLLIKRCLFAAILALVLVFFRTMYNPVIKSRREVHFPELHYVGSVPPLPGLAGKRGLNRIARIFQSLGRPSLLGERANANYMDMIFNNISARILNTHAKGKSTPRIISIMSATSGEGKTTISLRMAQCLARSGRRVLLVDCDLRRRALTRQLGLNASEGISEYLATPEKPDRKPLIKSTQKNLDFLPAGATPHSPMELFSGKSFREFGEAMRHYYDTIIFDTPPAIPCSEVIPLANASDFVALCLFSGMTRVDHLEEMMEKLNPPGARYMAGYILNSHRTGDSLKYYSAYSRYHPPEPLRPVA